MTDNGNTTLPKMPSELIRVAIADLEKAEQSKEYVVSMSTWHGRPWLSEPTELCAVCLAGAVMAFSLNSPATEDLVPSNFPNDTAVALDALDDLRSGYVLTALEKMGFAGHPAASQFYEFDEITDYEDHPTAFKREMLALADQLASAGL